MPVAEPKSLEERAKVANQCVAALDLPIPCLIDEMDDGMDRTWDAWPDRLFLIGRNGRVAWKSGHGPWGFEPSGLERAIAAELARPRSEREKRTARKLY